MPSIKLSQIVKLIQIINKGELEVNGKLTNFLGFEGVLNDLVKAVNETFEANVIDEKNVHDFEFTLTKKEEKND